MVALKDVSIFSTVIEAMLYGFSVLLYALTMWILVGARRRHRINYTMLIASCALWALATAEMAINIVRIYQGLISVGPSLPGGPEQYFKNNSDPTIVAKNTLYNAQMIIFDGMVIYRTYVVWQNFLVVVIPIIGWCGLLAASIGTSFARASPTEHVSELFSGKTSPWITTTYALDLGTNFFATGLLAYRIWTVTRNSSQYRSSSGLTPFLRVVIESGVIYSITISIGLTLFLVRSNGVYFMIDIASPIISIVFNMLVVRLGLAKERKERCCANQQIMTESFVAIAHPRRDPRERGEVRRRSDVDSVELGDVTVKISHLFAEDDVRDAYEAQDCDIENVKSVEELGPKEVGTVPVVREMTPRPDVFAI